MNFKWCHSWQIFNFFDFRQVSMEIAFFLCYTSFYTKEKGGDFVKEIGVVTVSVFRTYDNKINFEVHTNNEDVLPVSYVIEDTLKKY